MAVQFVNEVEPMPQAAKRRGPVGDPSKPCGYCKHAKDDHAANCPKAGSGGGKKRKVKTRGAKAATKGSGSIVAHIRALTERIEAGKAAERELAEIRDLLDD